MPRAFRFTLVVLAAALAAFVPSRLRADLGTHYSVTPIVSDQEGVAPNTDPLLQNPWGIAYFPGHPFWVSDNKPGVATVYNPSGSQLLVVPIPGPGGTGQGAPTGVVADPFSRTAFMGDQFIFATEDGTIAGWQPLTAQIRADRSGFGAVYKGLAVASSARGMLPAGVFLYAANFHDGTIDIFDSAYQPVSAPGAFTDPNAPEGYAPFNIVAMGQAVFVTYAKQDDAKHDDDPGAGHGFIDAFTTGGAFIKRVATGSAVGGSLDALNSPWGLSLPPQKFGVNPSALLVGNFGSGQIAALNLKDGTLFGLLTDSSGNPIAIDGLWGIIRGGGGLSGDLTKLYFTAGPGGEQHGLFGSIQPAVVGTASRHRRK